MQVHLPIHCAARIGITLAALAVLAIANIGIWQKETLIANSRNIFVKLIPYDPRSVMQGNYMDLRFDLPEMPKSERGTTIKAVARINEQGIAKIMQVYDGKMVSASEILIDLTPENAR